MRIRSHNYGTNGTYTVTLTVREGESLTSVLQRAVWQEQYCTTLENTYSAVWEALGLDSGDDTPQGEALQVLLGDVLGRAVKAIQKATTRKEALGIRNAALATLHNTGAVRRARRARLAHKCEAYAK